MYAVERIGLMTLRLPHHVQYTIVCVRVSLEFIMYKTHPFSVFFFFFVFNRYGFLTLSLSLDLYKSASGLFECVVNVFERLGPALSI